MFYLFSLPKGTNFALKFNIVMKKTLLIPACAALLLAACKPTEANYRQAYQAAMAAKNTEEADSIYGGMRRNINQSEMVVGTDTASYISQWVKVTDGGGGIKEYIKRYCVVAGQFKQAFNAKSMRERLAGNGYPGAFVVQNSEPYYYVIAASYNDAAPAIEMIEKLKADKDLKLRAPLPFVLRPAQYNR